MLTKEELAKLLREAAAAHHEYEETLKPLTDENWPDWYADFIVEKIKADDDAFKHLPLAGRITLGLRP